MFDRIARTFRPLITTCAQTMDRPCAAIGRACALAALATVSLPLAAQAPVATITAASPVTTGATGLAASVPVQSGATYAWTLSGGTITSGSASASIVYTAGATGTLTLGCTVTAADSTTAAGTKSVSVIAAPVATITAAAAVTTGTTGLKATVPTQSGATYAWTVTGGTVTAGATTASVTYTAGAVGSASLSCTVTNAAGTSATGAQPVAVVAPPATPVLTAATPVTTGVAGQTAAASSQAGVTYAWTVTGGTITAGQGTTNLTYTPGAVGTATLSCKATNAGGTAATGTTTVSVIAAPAVPVITTASPVVTGTGGLTASIPAQSGMTYAWSITGGTLASGQGSTSVTYSADVVGIVTLSCTATNAVGTVKTGTAAVMATPTGVMDVTGTYTCLYSNTMVLYQSGTQVTGRVADSYRGWQFTFQGTINGSVLTGTTTRLSDGAVGNVSVTFAPDASSFAGTWSTWASYGSWSGTKQAGVVSIQITPTSVLMQTGATQTFQAQVAGAFDKTVTWNTVGGSITTTGVFTAPTGVGGNAVITVTSEADTRKTATATIMATPTGVMDVTGTYTCLYSNTMVLYQSGTQVTGRVADSYRGWQFTFQGTINGSLLTGTTTRLSDGAVGNVSVTFAPDAASFAGSWSTWASYGSWSGTKQAGVVSVQISPTSVLMKTGATQAFQPSVAGSFNKAVTWTTTAGSIDANGVFTAPADNGGTYTVTATSVGDAMKTASATVMATPTGVMDVTGTYTCLYSNTMVLYQSGTQVTGSVADSYRGWQFTFQGTINGNLLTGTTTRLSDGAVGNVSVTFAPDASSFAGSWSTWASYGSWSGTKQAGVVSVQISPTSALMKTGATQTFQAQVAGSFNKAVTWTTTAGSIDANGVFTAPTGVGGNDVVTVTSAADTTKTASAIVMATPTGVMDVSGTYKDGWGYIFTLFQSGTSVWGTRVSGTIAATLSGNTLTGTIKDSTSNVTVFTWTFAPNGMSYSGLYAIAPATPNLAWTGTRQAGVSIQVSPTSALMLTGATQAFQSFVAGSFDKTVAWTATSGAVDANGVLTAPAPPGGNSTVTATSHADATKAASATVMATPTGVMDVSGTYKDSANITFTLFQNGTQVWGVRTWIDYYGTEANQIKGTMSGSVFSGTVSGHDNGTVSWTFAPDASSFTGYWIANGTTTHSAWNGTKQAGLVSIQLTPLTSTLTPTWSENFLAYVAGAFDKSIVWSVQEANGGSVSSAGTYTAPPAIGTFHVSATTATTPCTVATATVTAAVVNLQVLPAWTSLRPTAPVSFVATVQGVPVDAVTWSVQEGAAGGSVDTSGRYTASATPGVYHVVATSLYDATAKAVAEVHVSPDAIAHVTITPYVSQLGQGGTQQFSATVSNVSNTAVTWSCTGGAIDQNGLYTAPSAYGNYTVAATSVADPTSSDTANVVVSTGTGTDAVFTYDLNGNMTSDGTRTFEWDAENRLVAVVKGTHRSEFGYDGYGRRVEIRELDTDANGIWVPSTDTKYVWEGTQILESRSADGSTSLQRYYAQGFMDSDGTALYYTRDHLGSTRELVDAFGVIRARYGYDPFGRMTKLSGDKDSPFLYTGHLWHPYSGLYLTLYREYDANLGRWISRDPIGENAGLNIYDYVRNNPIRFYDPHGTDIDWDCFAPKLWNNFLDNGVPLLITAVGLAAAPEAALLIGLGGAAYGIGRGLYNFFSHAEPSPVPADLGNAFTIGGTITAANAVNNLNTDMSAASAEAAFANDLALSTNTALSSAFGIMGGALNLASGIAQGSKDVDACQKCKDKK